MEILQMGQSHARVFIGLRISAPKSGFFLWRPGRGFLRGSEGLILKEQAEIWKYEISPSSPTSIMAKPPSPMRSCDKPALLARGFPWIQPLSSRSAALRFTPKTLRFFILRPLRYTLGTQAEVVP